MTRATKATPARKPRTRKPATPKIIEPDTVEAQTRRAVANVRAAEAKRGANLPAVRTTTTPSLRSTAPVGTSNKTVATGGTVHDFDLDAALSKMDPTYIQCRDFGHSWRPFTARWVSASNAYESQLQCQRCMTVRTRWLTRTGGQVGGGYEYAEGYLVKGMGRLTGTDRDRVRLASILQVLEPHQLNGKTG